MKRFLALFLACFLSFSAPAQVGGPIIGQGGCTNNCTFTGNTVITGGTIRGTNVPDTFAKSGIPWFPANTGTMGNNGAITLGTALSRVIPKAYVWLPAGAIAAGVPAAATAYYVEMSSTTVGIVYNNLLSANVDAFGVPSFPASKTAFVTTGPGAYAGDTGTNVAYSITIPAGTLGPNGSLEALAGFTVNNTAGAKTAIIKLGGSGGTTYATSALANQAGGMTETYFTNQGDAAVQAGTNPTNAVYGVTTAPQTSTVNTAADTTVVITITRSTATDNMVLEFFRFTRFYGA